MRNGGVRTSFVLGERILKKKSIENVSSSRYVEMWERDAQIRSGIVVQAPYAKPERWDARQ